MRLSNFTTAAPAAGVTVAPESLPGLDESPGSGTAATPDAERRRLIGVITSHDEAEDRIRRPRRVLGVGAAPGYSRRLPAPGPDARLRLLVDLDVHPRVIMQILRHAQIAMTMEIYAQASSKATREALRRLGEQLGEPAAGEGV